MESKDWRRVPDGESLPTELATWAQAQPEILAIYLYGSCVDGRTGSLSDIDVAVWAAPGLSLEEIWRLEDRWSNHWPAAIDLRVLNLAPLPFRYEVTAHGLRLWAADGGQVPDFESRTWRLYWDQKPRRDRLWQEYVRQVTEERGEAERREYQAALAEIRAVHRRVREAAEDYAPDFPE